MQKVRLYKKLDRKNRCVDKRTLDDFRLLEEYAEFEVEGCIITEETSYVDILVENPSFDYFRLCEYTIMYIQQEEVGQNTSYNFLWAFIDKISQNNFNNYDNRSFRVRFTIDWWSTCLHNGFDIAPYVEGRIERSHVNDLRKYSYTQDGVEKSVIIPNLANTLEAEEEVTDYTVITKQLTPVTDFGVTWLYMIMRPTDILGAVDTFGTVFEFNNKYTRYPIVVLPIWNGTIVDVEISDTSGEDVTLYENKGFPSLISDEQVLAMFNSNIPPCDYSLKLSSAGQVTGVTFFPRSYARKRQISLYTADITTLTGSVVGIYPSIIDGVHKYCSTDLTDFGLSSSDINFNPKTWNSYSIEDSFEGYLNCISKFYSLHYTPLLLNSCGSKCVIDMARKIPQLDRIFINVRVDNGGVYCYTPTVNNTNMSTMTYGLGENVLYTPLISIDQLQQAKAIVNSLGGIVMTATGISKTTVGTINKIASNGTKTLQSILSYAEASRGVSNTLSSAQDFDYTINETEFVYYIPNNAVEILYRLATYGYNTTLEPWEVLTGHMRRYFNYIKTSSCTISNASIPLFIRKEIEQMFNEGVWLWNRGAIRGDLIGNFNTANYPLNIMEEN